MKMKHWQDAANALLGGWMLVSPWALGFSGDGLALANALAVGIALVAVAMGAFVAPEPWEEWVEFSLGVWLLVSPWAAGFATQQWATTNAFLVGALVIGFAVWVLMADRDFGWLREPRAR